MTGNTQRFSNRVEDYVKYRPHYPKEIISFFENTFGFNSNWVVADIGSGTGISSKNFVDNENLTFGLEPNDEMRAAQEQFLSSYSNFKSKNGTAENTHLPDNSVDLIFCAQAFHWFDMEKCKLEFERILKPNGKLVLAWNSRNTNSAFEQEYENVLINQIAEYKHINHRGIDDANIATFYSPLIMKKTTFKNDQKFDLSGFKGRLKSSSYCPKTGEKYVEIMRQLDELFTKHNKNNRVFFTYDTNIYWNE